MKWTGATSKWQVINLSDCSSVLTSAQHEFMHALGLDHEHARPDRDDYIVVNSELIGYSLLAAEDAFNYTNFEDRAVVPGHVRTPCAE